MSPESAIMLSRAYAQPQRSRRSTCAVSVTPFIVTAVGDAESEFGTLGASSDGAHELMLRSSPSKIARRERVEGIGFLDTIRYSKPQSIYPCSPAVIVESEAIVLRAMKHGETSKIVTLYTLAYGKVNVIAKGARDMKSKFGGALEMFARVSAVFYKKERAEAGLYLLSKAELVDAHRGIVADLDRIEAATAVCELVLRAIHDEQEHPEIFDLLAAALSEISKGTTSPILLQFEFYLEFLKTMGFAMTDDELRRLSPEAKHWLVHDGEQSLADKTQHELQSFFRSYFTEHLPGMTARSMKSEKVFSRM
jgi:hypothetical protein